MRFLLLFRYLFFLFYISLLVVQGCEHQSTQTDTEEEEKKERRKILPLPQIKTKHKTQPELTLHGEISTSCEFDDGTFLKTAGKDAIKRFKKEICCDEQINKVLDRFFQFVTYQYYMEVPEHGSVLLATSYFKSVLSYVLYDLNSTSTRILWHLTKLTSNWGPDSYVDLKGLRKLITIFKKEAQRICSDLKCIVHVEETENICHRDFVSSIEAMHSQIESLFSDIDSRYIFTTLFHFIKLKRKKTDAVLKRSLALHIVKDMIINKLKLLSQMKRSLNAHTAYNIKCLMSCKHIDRPEHVLILFYMAKYICNKHSLHLKDHFSMFHPVVKDIKKLRDRVKRDSFFLNRIYNAAAEELVSEFVNDQSIRSYVNNLASRKFNRVEVIECITALNDYYLLLKLEKSLEEILHITEMLMNMNIGVSSKNTLSDDINTIFQNKVSRVLLMMLDTMHEKVSEFENLYICSWVYKGVQCMDSLLESLNSALFYLDYMLMPQCENLAKEKRDREARANFRKDPATFSSTQEKEQVLTCENNERSTLGEQFYVGRALFDTLATFIQAVSRLTVTIELKTPDALEKSTAYVVNVGKMVRKAQLLFSQTL